MLWVINQENYDGTGKCCTCTVAPCSWPDNPMNEVCVWTLFVVLVAQKHAVVEKK